MASVNSLMVINFMKSHYGNEYSKQALAAELGIPLSAVIGSMNFLIKNGYAVTTREEEIVEEPVTEGKKPKVKTIKYHTLTEAGLAYDPEEEERLKAEKKAAEKAAKAAEKAAAKAAKAAAAAEA